jgi:ligand-binding SRPBCC domain-containing protein
VARSFAFEFSSRLAAPPAEVWAHATSMRGVNRELFPLVRMTHPNGLESLEGSRVPLGERAFRSWLLLFGVVPIDCDNLTFIELEPGRFLERSPMLSQREWQHERRVDACEGGCIVTDRVRSEPRIAALAPLFRSVFRMAFALRHRNLRRRFGAAV